jgi:xylulokinase
MDARGARYSEKLVGGGLEVPGTGYNARRLRAWLAKTGGVPSQTGKDPVGQIQFLKNERPDVYAADRDPGDVRPRSGPP